MHICVVGVGYVGLVTSACLAYVGNHVVAVDANAARIEQLRKGVVPFFEPGLDDLVKECIDKGTIEFSTELASGVKQADVIYIAVGTPPQPSGDPDMSFVMSVARSIGEALDDTKHRVVVNKSTVPVGSGNWVEMLIHQGVESKRPVAAGKSRPETMRFSVVSNPEFLREGSAILDSLYPDRIVVGAPDVSAVAIMKELYEPFLKQNFQAPNFCRRPSDCTEVPLVVTDLASAELIKYSANAFLAMKISFANEISGLCEKVGADIRQISRGIGLDQRIGERFLNAGVGWGGSCFGKDVSALIQIAKEYGLTASMLEATVNVNQRQRLVVIQKLQEELKIIKGRTIALAGLSFKPDTDDMRDAPSVTIARQLTKMGAAVRGFDPISNASCKRDFPDLDITYCSSLEELVAGVDAVVLVTEWKQFKDADWKHLTGLMKSPIVIDGRNALPEKVAVGAGITYRAIGH